VTDLLLYDELNATKRNLILTAVGKKLVEDLSAQEVVTPGSPWFLGSRMAGSPWFAAVAVVDPVVLVHPDVKFSL
jgi:hypothetical protein